VNFDDLDARMRVYETAHDFCVPPGVFMVARIDGRGFTRLTKEVHPFEAPFDARMRDYMVGTVEHLMSCGFRVAFGYTQSDEISLLLDRDESVFGRKLRKLISILAGEASAKFSLLLGDLAAFDCRISQLPDPQTVVDYFRWRAEDARRNALSAHCYWTLRRQGRDPREADQALSGLSMEAKSELLSTQGNLEFNSLPGWQTRGIGIYWEDYPKEALNPLTGETVTTIRRRLKRDMDLPSGEAYGDLIRKIASGGP
jgi:tRNA(His) 5'-end guanylyltransferase